MPKIRLIDLHDGQTSVDQRGVPLPSDAFQRQQLASDPKTTAAQFRALILDPVFSVRYAAATSEWTPPSLLALMMVDTHPVVRAGVARNPRTPGYALKVLIKDADPTVRDVAQVAWAARHREQARGPE